MIVNQCQNETGIGGYMEMEQYHGVQYHPKALKFNAARYAIKYAILCRAYSKVYIPAYLCSCISQMLSEMSVAYDVYRVDENWLPVLERIDDAESCVLIVNYFGQLRNSEIEKLQLKYHNILVDNTQAFFQQPVEGIDTVYTCRKYFGVADGAYLYTQIDSTLYETLLIDQSAGRMAFVLGRYETGPQAHYATFRENEQLLADAGMCRMSRITENILRSIDYTHCIDRRRKNVRYLSEHLSQLNKLDVKYDAGLFMYPLLAPIDNLRENLIKQNIFVACLWPALSVSEAQAKREMALAKSIIWLPIDQRYGENEMQKIVLAIKAN